MPADTTNLDAKIDDVKVNIASKQKTLDEHPLSAQLTEIQGMADEIQRLRLDLKGLENKKSSILDAQKQIDEATKTIDDVNKSIG